MNHKGRLEGYDGHNKSKRENNDDFKNEIFLHNDKINVFSNNGQSPISAIKSLKKNGKSYNNQDYNSQPNTMQQMVNPGLKTLESAMSPVGNTVF